MAQASYLCNPMRALITNARLTASTDPYTQSFASALTAGGVS
jgi:hypothetical protein